MYAIITNFIAQNEMQMDMWIEFFFKVNLPS